MTGPRAQRGVAVVVAVLVVALATSTAAYMLWHQSLWLRQVENLTARAQADALARAAAAWAAAILAEDDPAIDHLGETWARRMPPLPGRGHAELAGAITDEQAKFNVNNLAGEGGREPARAPRVPAPARRGRPAGRARRGDRRLDRSPTTTVTPPNGAEDLALPRARPRPIAPPTGRIADLAELARVKGFDARAARAARAVRHRAAGRDAGEREHRAARRAARACCPALGPRGRHAPRRAARASVRSRSRDEFLRALPRAAGRVDRRADRREAAGSSAPRRRCASVASRPATARSSSAGTRRPRPSALSR